MIINYKGYEVCISAKSKYFPEKGFTDENACDLLNSIMTDHLIISELKEIPFYMREDDEELFVQLKKRGLYNE